MEANGRERTSKTMPVDAKCFTAATTSEIGTDLTIEFSKQIPVVQAKVSGRKTETDGTVITHLSVAGAPEGQLTIQENASMGFFVAQLYYQNHPVAYEFKKADDAMVATRHELSEMICSLIDHQTAEVTHMGLPPVDKVRGKKAEEEEQAAIERSKKLVQEAKPGGGGTTSLSLSIADACVTEGTSGSKSLTFTVRLSKADRNRVITLNGFGYRADAVPNTIAGAVALTGAAPSFSANGILETTGDQDLYSFSTAGGACSFSALGDALSQNVDVLLEILDGTGAVIASTNPDTLTDASVSATLAAGTYYLRISGTGRGDVLADGYSNYASIGQYTISGNAP